MYGAPARSRRGVVVQLQLQMQGPLIRIMMHHVLSGNHVVFSMGKYGKHFHIIFINCGLVAETDHTIYVQGTLFEHYRLESPTVGN